MDMMKSVENGYKIISFIDEKFSRMLGMDTVNITVTNAICIAGLLASDSLEKYKESDEKPTIHLAFARQIIFTFLSTRSKYNAESLSTSILREAAYPLPRANPTEILSYVEKDRDRAYRMIDEFVGTIMRSKHRRKTSEVTL